jgi:hypothetical protein
VRTRCTTGLIAGSSGPQSPNGFQGLCALLAATGSQLGRKRPQVGSQIGVSELPDSYYAVHQDERLLERELDLLVELDRTRRPVKNVDKFHRYDALLTAWWRSHERYRGAKEGPAVVFMCVDEEAAFNLMENFQAWEPTPRAGA